MRADIQADIAAAMDSDLADTVEAFEAQRVSVSDTLDPVTGTYPETTETWAGRWIRDTWTVQELDTQHIESTDIKRVVLQNETPWVPKPGDTVDGYRVVDAQQDGALATWTIQLRRS
jgi:hypothetical protein